MNKPPAFAGIDAGEAEAIQLALEAQADLLLVDDMAGRRVAREAGLTVTGLVGVLDDAGHRGLVDVAVAVAKLRQTNFYLSAALAEYLLSRHRS